MKKTKTMFIYLLSALMLLNLCACASSGEDTAEDGRFHILASNFPAYDFACRIAGERCSVTMLVPPGSEAHSYEPGAQDIIALQNCELLFCNGGVGEAWLEILVSGSEREVPVLYMTECVSLLEEERVEGMQKAAHSHEHVHDESCEDEHGHGHEDAEESHSHTEYDEHVWTSPVNAMAICRALCEKLCVLDPEGEGIYRANLEAYLAELETLHQGFLETVEGGGRRTVIFSDRFPVRYFVEEYGLEYFAAFPGCAEEAEPSARTVAFLIDRVREDKTPAVFYIEFSNEKMADVIVEDTGCEKLLFHSCHNVSADDFESGVSYLQLMTANLANLKEALG